MKKYLFTMIVMAVFAIGFAASDDTGSSSSSSYSSSQPRQKEEHEFFENGYTYSADYSVHRQQGYGGGVVHHNYLLKIYNDGTKELTYNYGTIKKTAECKIEKRSISKRDVSATWYEINGGGEYKIVDEEGYIYELYVSDDTSKEIQEAVASKTCRFGKFRKEKLTKKGYTCRTCGKEYDPSREPIYSEDYCWDDYPLTCERCGKNYTIRKEMQAGSSATNDMCGRCYEKWQSYQIVHSVTKGKY